MAENRPHRILIVDDREQNRYILARVLRQAGYPCDYASSGREAMEKAHTSPSLIILDVHLPDASGFDICRRLKQDPTTSHIPVLQISAAFISAEDRAKSLEAGADGYLTHPIDSVVLIATVRSLLRLRAAEAVARQSAVQWQSTFDALSEGLALVDAKAFLQLCSHITGCAAGENASKILHDLLGTDAPLLHDGDERYSADFLVNGRTIRASVDPVDLGGAGPGKIVVLADITDGKLAEYAIRTAEKLAATLPMPSLMRSTTRLRRW
jgi:CheY-like chemotaxis protein